MKRVDYTGQRFGRLIVVAMAVVEAKSWCECVCDCGARKRIVHHSLRNGVTRSCGCLASERITAANTTHGDTAGGPSAEWISWRAMHQRCKDPKHKSFMDYGRRGIKVCARWDSFENFLEDMGRRPSPTHSIERVENSGNYYPANCTWATKSEQARNRRLRRAA